MAIEEKNVAICSFIFCFFFYLIVLRKPTNKYETRWNEIDKNKFCCLTFRVIRKEFGRHIFLSFKLLIAFRMIENVRRKLTATITKQERRTSFVYAVVSTRQSNCNNDSVYTQKIRNKTMKKYLCMYESINRCNNNE